MQETKLLMEKQFHSDAIVQNQITTGLMVEILAMGNLESEFISNTNYN